MPPFQPTKVIQCTHLNTVTAHQLPINALRVAAISAVTASDDHTLKLFDLRTCRQTHTLNGHNAPVLIACVDEADQVGWRISVTLLYHQLTPSHSNVK